MTRSSAFVRRNSTPCSLFSTPGDGVLLPDMICEKWPELMPACRATSFWLIPWAFIRSHTARRSTSGHLAGATAELGSLSNLTELDLGGNELSGEIPAELGSLSNLETLELGFIDLSGCVPIGLEAQLIPYSFNPPFC